MSTRAAKPSSNPVDQDGIPFYSAREIAELIALHPDSMKKLVHQKPIPHYVEIKGLGGLRTWFRLRELALFFKELKDPRYETLSSLHEKHLQDIKQRISKGEVVETLHKPNLISSTFEVRLFHFPYGRTGPAFHQGTEFKGDLSRFLNRKS